MFCCAIQAADFLAPISQLGFPTQPHFWHCFFLN